MHILVTIDKNYLNQLLVMLYSYKENNNNFTKVYIMNKDLNEEDINKLNEKLNTKKIELIDIKIDDALFKKAPSTKRFPISMYYRLLAYKYLPDDLDKILYLDPDIIINKDISELYNLDISNYCFAAATHINNSFLQRFNEIRLNMNKNSSYINSGVLLMNLKNLRNSDIKEKEIYNFIEQNKLSLFLPDQDIISKLYENNILLIESNLYNMTEKLLRNNEYEWVVNNTKIIHYCGKNKPWKKNYCGKLNTIYLKYENKLLEV